jgi:hypothetical protein
VTLDRTALGDIAHLTARYRAREMGPAEYAACYVLRWQCARHGDRMALRRSRRDAKPHGAAWWTQLDGLPARERIAALVEFLDRYHLREISQRVNIALVGWLRGEWNLTLCENIPSVRDVLRMQTQGTRPVTVIAEYPRLCEPILDKSDGLAFICHDLEHAWQFFHDSERHAEQRRLAHWLERAIEQGVFASYTDDPVFAQKFDYLAADMNTHVVHSLQYLRAILLDFHLRAEGKAPNDQLCDTSRADLNRCIERFGAESGLVAIGLMEFLALPVRNAEQRA